MSPFCSLVAVLEGEGREVVWDGGANEWVTGVGVDGSL